MISVLLGSRKKDNLSSNLSGFLDSIVEYTSNSEKKNIEVILKFDSDDTIPNYITNSKYPFDIKYEQWARGEGRYAMQDIYTYLYTIRNPRSRFIFCPSDDFIMKRPFVDEILSQDSEYRILGGGTGISACCLKTGHYTDITSCNCPILPDPLTIPLGISHRDHNSWRGCVAAYCPIFGTKILEATSNPGLMPSYDAYFIALSLALYKMYNINVWRDMKSFYYRNENPHYAHNVPEYNKTVKKYNKLDFQFYTDYNPIVWNLIEQHAKNVYLNMKHDGLL